MTYHWEQPLPPRKPELEIADAHAWAQFTRALLGWIDITEDEIDDPVVLTEFRAWANLPRRTESQLRKIAAQQVAEARTRLAAP